MLSSPESAQGLRTRKRQNEESKPPSPISYSKTATASAAKREQVGVPGLRDKHSSRGPLTLFRRYFTTKSTFDYVCVSHTDPFPSFTEKRGEIVNLDFSRDLTTSLVIPFWRKKDLSMSYQCSQVSEAFQEILTQWVGDGTRGLYL